MQANLQGYDYAYEIDQTALMASLDNLIGAPLQQILRTQALSVLLPSPAPANTVQTGTLQLLSQRAVTLQMPAASDASSVVFTVTFPETNLELNAVAGITGTLGQVGNFAGVGAFPATNIGPLVIAMTLQITSIPGNGKATIQIAVTPGTTIAITPPPSATLDPLLKPLAVFDITSAVTAAITTAVTNELSTLLPLSLNVPFGLPNVCGIGIRDLSIKLLTTGAKPALGFFMMALGSMPASSPPSTASSLTAANDAAISISNELFLKLICCAMQTGSTITGLGTDTETDGQCVWNNVQNVKLGSETVTVNFLKLSLDTSGAQNTVEMSMKVTEGVTGGTVWAQVDVSLSLNLQPSGALGVIEATPTITSGHDFDVWGWIIASVGAVIGALVGLIVGVFTDQGNIGTDVIAGAIIGALIGIALGIGTVELITSAANVVLNRVTGAVGALGGSNGSILPDALTSNFGSLNLTNTLDFDDLFMGGKYMLPHQNAYSHGENVVLKIGDSIDLDSGLIQHAGQPIAGFPLAGDLSWVPAPLQIEAEALHVITGAGGITQIQGGNLTSIGSAKMMPLSSSYWSLIASTLSTIAFPSTPIGIAGTTLPVSSGEYPRGSAVFALRTTDARLAKGIAWRDSAQQLHLSYVTYDTAVPLAIGAKWVTTDGPVVTAGPIYNTIDVSRKGTFNAISRALGGSWLPGAVIYTWLWNGSQISGTVQMPNNGPLFVVNGGIVTVQTAMGVALTGLLQVEAKTLFGTQTYIATLDINEPGTARSYNVSVTSGHLNQVTSVTTGVTSQPVNPVVIAPITTTLEQLPAAFALGMNIAPETAVFR